MAADILFPNLIATVCLEGNLRIYDIKQGTTLAQIIRTSQQRSTSKIKKDEYKTKAMLYHGLTYKNGQIAFQSQSRTNGFFFTRDRQCDQSLVSSPTVWSIVMINHYVILGLSDGTVETYRLKEKFKLLKTGSINTNKSGICHLLTTANGAMAINLFAEIFFFDFHEDTLVMRQFFSSGHTHPITVAKLLMKQLVTGSTDETIRVISTDNGKVVHVLKGHLFPITALGLCKNGKGQSDAKGLL